MVHGMEAFLSPRGPRKAWGPRFGPVEYTRGLPAKALPAKVEPGKGAVVVGGGLAGLAAATVLAERGVRVTVMEREAYLGGRAGAFGDRLATGKSFAMERGFHAFFRQYYNLRNLLRRFDPGLSTLERLADYPLLGPGGRCESFAHLPATPPFNVIALLRRTRSLHLVDILRADPWKGLEMLAYDWDRTYGRFGDVTAREYLDSVGLPNDARHMLFDVFAHSFFNPEDNFSAAELLMMFHFYFTGNPEGLVFDVLTEPFSLALFGPLRRYLENNGVQFMLRNPVSRIARADGGGYTVLSENRDPLTADGVVLALDVPGLKRLVSASPDLSDVGFLRRIQALDVTLPFAVQRLWLDGPVAADCVAFAGTTGLGILDNISVYERFEGESRRWSLTHGGSVVELHAYAVPEFMGEAEIKEDLLKGLHLAYPETRGLRILEDRFLLRRDCPAFPPGSHRQRLTVNTPHDGLVLAGNFVDLPFPSALMERAVSSGMMAANHILSRWHARPEPIFSVPPRGVFAGFVK